MVCPTSPQAPHLGGPFTVLEPEFEVGGAFGRVDMALVRMGMALGVARGAVGVALGFLAGLGMALGFLAGMGVAPGILAGVGVALGFLAGVGMELGFSVSVIHSFLAGLPVALLSSKSFLSSVVLVNYNNN